MLAALAGAASALGWAPFAIWPLALAGFALLFALVRTAAKPWHAAAIGLAFGLGLHLAGHGWIFAALHAQVGVGALAAALSTGLVACYLAAFIALPCAFSRLASARLSRRLPPSVAAIAAAASHAGLLTVGEWLRSVAFNGFTSLSLGYAMLDTWLAGYVPVGGLYLASWSALLLGALLAIARGRRAALAAVCVVVATGWALGQLDWSRPSGPALGYRLLQANIAQALKFDPAHARRHAERLVDAIEQVPAELIVTPETAFPMFLDALPAETLPRLQRFSRESGSHLFIGIAVAAANSDGTNSVLGLSPRGIARYDKVRLMPFGEYSPAGFAWYTRRLAIPLKDLSAGAADQAPFSVELGGRTLRIGTLICHEELIGRDARRRAATSELLLNPSNLAWFDGGAAIEQRLQIARLRALEVGRPILRVANTGVTAQIDHRGRVAAQLATASDGVLSGRVQPTRGQTPYVQAGDLLPLSLCLLCLLPIAMPGRSPRDQAPTVASEADSATPTVRRRTPARGSRRRTRHRAAARRRSRSHHWPASAPWRSARAPPDRNPVGNGPDEEAAEQQHVGEAAIGEQVGDRPQHHREQHRMPRLGADLPRQIGRKQQREDRQHQQQRQVAQPGRRRIQHDRRLPRQPEAVDQQHQPDRRGDRIKPFPRADAAPRDLGGAPLRRDDRDAVDAEEHDEADDEQGHGKVLSREPPECRPAT